MYKYIEYNILSSIIVQINVPWIINLNLHPYNLSFLLYMYKKIIKQYIIKGSKFS